MKIRTLLAILTLAVLGLFAVSAQAQTVSLTQTTLAAAVSTTYGTYVTVASGTGISAPNPTPGGPTAVGGTVTDIFADGELMTVEAINSAGTGLTVQRGASGTLSVTHSSGAVVWAGPASAFKEIDPSGSCTAAGNPSPWINVRNGRQFLCDSGTNQWLPVLGGSFTPTATSGAIQTVGQTMTVAGLIAGEPIFLVSSPTPTSLCPPVGVQVSAANTVKVFFTVLTAAACTPASGTYYFMAPLRSIGDFTRP